MYIDAIAGYYCEQLLGMQSKPVLTNFECRLFHERSLTLNVKLFYMQGLEIHVGSLLKKHGNSMTGYSVQGSKVRQSSQGTL